MTAGLARVVRRHTCAACEIEPDARVCHNAPGQTRQTRPGATHRDFGRLRGRLELEDVGVSVVAVILAGGQGERLSVLSVKRAKPAVPFAGKYRIIDFALSNVVNSGIYHAAILTQYRPHSLHDHIGVGKPWDLDRARGGVRLLQPYLGPARVRLVQGHRRRRLPEPADAGGLEDGSRLDPLRRSHLQDGLREDDRLPP